MEINPAKYYNLSELLDFIPWIESLPALRRWVELDRRTNNYLKAVKYVGKGTSGTRYHILGENIIQYLVQAEEGKLEQQLTHK